MLSSQPALIALGLQARLPFRLPSGSGEPYERQYRTFMTRIRTAYDWSQNIRVSVLPPSYRAGYNPAHSHNPGKGVHQWHIAGIAVPQ